jgi:MoaE-MoaD fusion protein
LDDGDEAVIVRVKLFASQRESVGQRELALELPEGATVGDAFGKLTTAYPALARAAAATLFAVNRSYVEESTVLNDGDELALLPPVSGGAEMFEITEDPIEVEPIIERVRSDADGAVVTFVGMVRNLSRNKNITYLEYDAYKDMAVAELRRIGEEIKDLWDVERVSIVHRIGRMEIGETIVVIAVASPHRAKAFDACEYAIDRLKEIVPIWKKEVATDGETWIEGG